MPVRFADLQLQYQTIKGEIAKIALKVAPGDEVITTAHSWISTSAMISHAGASVVFADIDDATFTIDPAAIEAAIALRTVRIIPVHLYGQPADMDAIIAIARKHKLWVIEERLGCAAGLKETSRAPAPARSAVVA